jgi:MAF protein/D-tyrosyl-tRNA(Tyr) deacylase
MRAVLQRVARARVAVDREVTGAVGTGLLVLAGVRKGDTADDAAWIAAKIAGLRIFPDEAGRMNRSVGEAGGAVLLVSQFTLYGDVRKGRRPSFDRAAPPEEAVPLLDALKRELEASGLRVETGRFGAHMEVDLRNDGPVTILLDSEDRSRGGGAGTATAGDRQRLAAGASPPLILASASPRRRALLEEVGLRFTVEPVDVDESADLPPDPAEHARVLAERKAHAAADGRREGIIVAADTIVVLGGRVYGKPAGESEAMRMLGDLAGREHTVITGVCVLDAASGRRRSTVVSTLVRFHALSRDEIRRYVATGEPLDKAGAYAIQGRGALLVAGIEGDWSNVVGLPVGAMLDLIEEVAGGGSAAGGAGRVDAGGAGAGGTR